jgi:anti-sigma factor RsiW
MPRHDDEALVAYLDGELDDSERRHVEAWLDADPAVRERLAALAQVTDLVRSAYAPVAGEAVPERLLAAARGERPGVAAGAKAPQQEAEILVLRPTTTAAVVASRRWHIGLAAAAGLFGVVFGGAGTYFGMGLLDPISPAAEHQIAAAAANDIWLDNAAGYYKLTVSAGDNMLIDVPASNDPSAALQKISQSLPQQVRLPNLKPWGLTFRGARLVVVDGKPAAQLVYVTDNKAIGPLTLVIGASKLPAIAPTLDRRQDLNVLYWRHQGRAYALVGKTDIGYLWGIANDVAWQLDAI